MTAYRAPARRQATEVGVGHEALSRRGRLYDLGTHILVLLTDLGRLKRWVWVGVWRSRSAPKDANVVHVFATRLAHGRRRRALGPEPMISGLTNIDIAMRHLQFFSTLSK